MAAIGPYNWGSRLSPWKEAEAWRSRRSAATADSMNAYDNTNSLFAQAHSNQVAGYAKLAMEAAVKRVNLAAKAKFDQIANTKVAGLDDPPKVDKTA
jgi:hypothetical protein